MHAPTRGRPRSERARQAVLSAAVALIAEHGYGALTMEAVARRAGVSKQTLYRWWPGTAEIVLEALVEGSAAVAPAPDSGSLAGDLQIFLRRTVVGAGGANARLLAALMAETQIDADFGDSFRREFLAHRRQVLAGLLERGRAHGEVAAGVDIDFLAELVFGALWYRILSHNGPVNRAFADALSATVLRLAVPDGPRGHG